MHHDVHDVFVFIDLECFVYRVVNGWEWGKLHGDILYLMYKSNEQYC